MFKAKPGKTFMFNAVALAVIALAATMPISIAFASPWHGTNTPSPPLDCSKSTLTGEKFMDMFHAIAMYGDLRDVPFIEKTLGVKFHSEHPHGNDEQANVHSTIYSAVVPGTQFETNLYVGDDDVQIRQDIENASIFFNRFEKLPFSQCLHITKAQFESHFNSQFWVSGVVGSGINEDKLVEPLSGKNGSTIQVEYTYDYKNDAIIGSDIKEYPPKAKP